MLIVSLDQCAISALALQPADKPIFAEIRRLLIEGVKDGQVLCPVAPETVLETARCKRIDRTAIHHLHCSLANASTGREVPFFKTMWQLINEKTLALVRPVSPTCPIELRTWVRIEDDGLASEVWEDIVLAKQSMRQRVESQPLVEVSGRPTLEFLRRAVILEHVQHVYRQLSRLLRQEEPDTSDHMGVALAFYLCRLNATSDEIRTILEAVTERKWEQIDVVFYRGLLSAQLELEWRWKPTPRAYDVNDEFDIPRIVVALSAADIFITDRKMAQLCVKSKVAQYSPTKVVGMNNLEMALELLRDHLR